MVSVIGNVVPGFATSVETITLFADQVKIRLIFSLKVNESVTLFLPKSATSPLLFTAGISLLYCH